MNKTTFTQMMGRLAFFLCFFLFVWWGNTIAANQYSQYRGEGYYQFGDSILFMGYRIVESPNILAPMLQLVLSFKILKPVDPATSFWCRVEYTENQFELQQRLLPASVQPTSTYPYFIEQSIAIPHAPNHFFFYLSIPDKNVCFLSDGVTYEDTRWISQGWLQHYVNRE
jgi:hypothetical protein